VSARLRDAVRALLHEIEQEARIQAGSPLAPLRDALADEDRRLVDIEPDVVSDRDARIARLVQALQHFAKPGGHFVGCPADKVGGTCSAACRSAQLAIDKQALKVTADAMGVLQQEVAALRREWRHIRGRLHNQKLIHRRVLQQVQAETGFVMRTPGRPKKAAPAGEAKDGAHAPTTATPRSTDANPEPVRADLADRRRGG
jgi:hypothetical protein